LNSLPFIRSLVIGCFSHHQLLAFFILVMDYLIGLLLEPIKMFVISSVAPRGQGT